MFRKNQFIFVIPFLLLSLAGCVKKDTVVMINQTAVNGGESRSVNQDGAKKAESNEPAAVSDAPAAVAVTILAKLDLGAPFVSQAPLRDWSMPYQEACEEASMLSAAKHFNRTAVDRQTINDELLALIKWEAENGYGVDLDAAETVEVLQSYFGLTAKLETDVSVDRIKYELANGRLLIVPTAGRMLGNPYFSGEGPIYHMLVIRGYDEKNFITNDVGTNTKGEKFRYTYRTLLDSIHDWNHDLAADGLTEEEMRGGRKVMIVVGNNQ